MVEVEDVFPLEVIAFLVVFLVLLGTGHIQPLAVSPEEGMALMVIIGGLLIVFGILLSIVIAEAADYVLKRRGKS